MHALTLIIPSFNEAENVQPMIDRLDAVFEQRPDLLVRGRVQVLYVDDSTDDTPDRVAAAARTAATLDVQVAHRPVATGGLAGAVAAGLLAARGDVVVVMDADLQHPPETVPSLIDALGEHVDVVVASRYLDGGSSDGLEGSWRTLVSRSSTYAAKLVFPGRLGACSDPMTGFFALRLERVDLNRLHPRGFKILLEILASQPLRVAQVPLAFAERLAGESKASLRNGLIYARQLAALRARAWITSRVLRFAAVGALGAGVNLAVMAGLLMLGVHYVAASIISAEVTILGYFALQERVVFHDLARASIASPRSRLAGWLAFTNAELVCRTPLLVALVSLTGLSSLTVQGLLLALGFGVRFLFSRHLLYRLAKVRLPRPRAELVLPHLSHPSADLTVEDILVSARPWGQFEQFCLNEQVTVKLITVQPGSRLSLQTHVHREEFWQVLDVPLDITVGDTSWTAAVGERVLIKAGEAHRLGNSGARPGRILELARGHFDEADIVRLHDDYTRASHVGALRATPLAQP